MIKRILVGLGGTPYASAKIKHAIDLTLTHKAEITGVTIIDAERLADVGPVPVGGGPAASELREWREQEAYQHLETAINDFSTACTQAKVEYKIIHEKGDEFEELMSLWPYQDLTVLGLKGLFEYGVLSDPHNAIISLLKNGVRPILAVAQEYRPISRAIIAFNGSMESAAAMKRFVQMQAWPEAELRIVCFGKSHNDAGHFLKNAEEYCKAHGFQADTAIVEGGPRDVMIDYASAWNADLIVMGSTNRSKLAKLVMGDTVAHMIQNAEIPLFLSQ